MLFPTICSRVDVQVAKRTTISSCEWFGWKALFFLYMGFVYFLMDCFFASWAFLIVFTVCTFTYQMRSKSANLYSLSTLIADNKHRAGIEVMHVFIVLLDKSFINSFAELALLVFVYLVYLFACWLFRDLNELISCLHLRRWLLSSDSSFLWSFRFDWFLI